MAGIGLGAAIGKLLTVAKIGGGVYATGKFIVPFLQNNWQRIAGRPPTENEIKIFKSLGAIATIEGNGVKWAVGEATPSKETLDQAVKYLDATGLTDGSANPSSATPAATEEQFKFEDKAKEKPINDGILGNQFVKSSNISVHLNNEAKKALVGLDQKVLEDFSKALTDIKPPPADLDKDDDKFAEWKAGQIKDAAIKGVASLPENKKKEAYEKIAKSFDQLSGSEASVTDPKYGRSMFWTTAMLGQLAGIDEYKEKTLADSKNDYEKWAKAHPHGDQLEATGSGSKWPEQTAQESINAWAAEGEKVRQYMNKGASNDSIIVGNQGVGFRISSLGNGMYGVQSGEMQSDGSINIKPGSKDALMTTQDIAGPQGMIRVMQSSNEPSVYTDNFVSLHVPDDSDRKKRMDFFNVYGNPAGSTASRAVIAEHRAADLRLGASYQGPANTSLMLPPMPDRGFYSFGNVATVYREGEDQFRITFNSQQKKPGLFGSSTINHSTNYEVDGNYIASMWKDYQSAPTTDTANNIIVQAAADPYAYAAAKGLPADKIKKGADAPTLNQPAAPVAGSGQGNLNGLKAAPVQAIEPEPPAHMSAADVAAAWKKKTESRKPESALTS